MKRVLLFILFAPILGVLSYYTIMLLLKSLNVNSENPSELGVGLFAFTLIYSYIYTSPATVLVGLLSTLVNFDNKWHFAFLCVASAALSSICLHLFFGYKQFDLIWLAVMPSIISTLLIGSLIRWRNY